MENIIMLGGNAAYTITLDPSVWIFDDRKVDLDTYFLNTGTKANELEEYTKEVSKHWDREIMEGAIFPPTLKTEKKFEKEKMLTGTFGIKLEAFINNAEPAPDASSFVIELEDGEVSLPLNEAKQLILGFSQNGKPLKEDGPVYVYYGDGRNRLAPIKRVKAFRIQ